MASRIKVDRHVAVAGTDRARIYGLGQLARLEVVHRVLDDDTGAIAAPAFSSFAAGDRAQVSR
jgi:hypothetical protein